MSARLLRRPTALLLALLALAACGGASARIAWSFGPADGVEFIGVHDGFLDAIATG